jgi:hypothetical protein
VFCVDATSLFVVVRINFLVLLEEKYIEHRSFAETLETIFHQHACLATEEKKPISSFNELK